MVKRNVVPIPYLDLFSGIGGHALALQGLATPVGFCDIDPHARSVLSRHIECFGNAPIFEDVRSLHATDVCSKSNVKNFPQFITASFPCQDISPAGLGLGIHGGTRSGLVFEVFRLIDEFDKISPSRIRGAYLENSTALRMNGLDDIIGKLSKRGFTCLWGQMSASDVGARHRRSRIWVLAIRGTAPLISLPPAVTNSNNDKNNKKSPLPSELNDLLLGLSSRPKAASSSSSSSNEDSCGAITVASHDFIRMERVTPRLVKRPPMAVASRMRKRWSSLGNAVVPQVSRTAFVALNALFVRGARGEQGMLKDHFSGGDEVRKERYAFLKFENQFIPDNTVRHWLTPIHNKTHFYPTLNVSRRFMGMFATRLFHEEDTQKTFGFTDVRDGRKMYIVNICWVEALMGFPKDWTRVDPARDPV